MKKALITAVLLLSVSAPSLAETASEFAARLQDHFGSVAADPRVRLVALNASPSDVVVELGLTAEGKAQNVRVVHSILSDDDEQLVLEALDALPPFPINGYAAFDGNYRLPIRLNVVSPTSAD